MPYGVFGHVYPVGRPPHMCAPSPQLPSLLTRQHSGGSIPVLGHRVKRTDAFQESRHVAAKGRGGEEGQPPLLLYM